MKDSAAMHVRERASHMLEDHDSLAECQALEQRREALAGNVLHEQFATNDAEELFLVAIIVILQCRRMTELLGGFGRGAAARSRASSAGCSRLTTFSA